MGTVTSTFQASRISFILDDALNTSSSNAVITMHTLLLIGRLVYSLPHKGPYGEDMTQLGDVWGDLSYYYLLYFLLEKKKKRDQDFWNVLHCQGS